MKLNFQLSPALDALLADIRAAGGRPLLAGGCIRDALMGLTSKDTDIEVHGLGSEPLRQVVARHGRVFVVGVSFGVLKVYLPDGQELDVSLPCRRSVKGAGGFIIEPDPNTTPREAAARRDFT